MRSVRLSRPGFVHLAGTALALLCLIVPARASVMRYLEVEELARASTLVARARIVGTETRWTADRRGIYTEIRAVLTGHIAAATAQPPIGRVLTIIQAGGEVDEVRLDWTGRPTFRKGEDLVLFLEPYEPGDLTDARFLVVGGKQGRMKVLPAASASGESAIGLVVERDLQGVLEAEHFPDVEPDGPGHQRNRMTWDELSRRAMKVGGGR